MGTDMFDDIKKSVADINQSMYDFKDVETDKDFYREEAGFTKEIVEKVSKEKNDPEWMRQFRLKCLDIYNSMEMPNWGPDTSELNMDLISSYVKLCAPKAVYFS